MQKILIIKHGSLGDIILSMCSIFSVKNHFKNSKITILTEKKYYELFKNVPVIDNVKFDNRPKFFYFMSYLKLCTWFHKEKFDWVFDLQTSNRTNIYYFIFSLFSDFKWSGIARTCSHPHVNPLRKKMHTLERQKDQLEVAGITSKANFDWSFFKSDISKFKLNNNLFLLVIGGSVHRPQKRWSIKNYVSLIKYLNEKKICPLIIGGESETKYIDKKLFSGLKFKNLVGKTSYFDLAEIARKSKWIVGNDTGPMHLLVQCSKSNTKKIVLFGSQSNPKLCAPRGKNVFIIQKNQINNITLKDILKFLDKKKIELFSDFSYK